MSHYQEKHYYVARATYETAVTLLFDDTQVSIDVNNIDVNRHAGQYCPKGAWRGRFTFAKYKAVVVRYAPLLRPGALLIFERIGEDHFRHGVRHPPEAVCTVQELERPFVKWANMTWIPFVSENDVKDVKHDVFVKTAEGLNKEKFIVYSPAAFFNASARNIQMNRWRGKRTTFLSPEDAASIPAPDTVTNALEIADEMAAAVCSLDLNPSTLYFLRTELVKTDPSGAVLLLGKYLQTILPGGLFRFYECWVQQGGDIENTAKSLGVAPGSIRTFLYRIRFAIQQDMDARNEAA